MDIEYSGPDVEEGLQSQLRSLSVLHSAIVRDALDASQDDSFGELDEAAERVREAHVVDRLAVDVEERRRADEVRKALRARDSDVQSIPRHLN